MSYSTSLLNTYNFKTLVINRHSFWRNLLLIWYNNDAFGMNWSVTAVLIIESFWGHVSIEGIQWLDELLKGLWTLAQKGKWNKIIGKVDENIERTDIQKKRYWPRWWPGSPAYWGWAGTRWWWQGGVSQPGRRGRSPVLYRRWWQCQWAFSSWLSPSS